MLKIRCPQCDTVNYEGYMGFPICHKCHEHLIKCRYCESFDTQFYVCAHPKRVDELGPSVDPDLGRSCPYFASLHLVREPSPAARTTRTWTAILIGILAAMAVIAFVALGLHSPQPVADMRVEFPPRCELGAAVVGTISINNPSASDQLLCLIRVGKDFFTGFDILKTEPHPEVFWLDEKGRCYSFLPVASARKRNLRFYCQAKREGAFPLEVEVLDRRRNTLTHSRLILRVSSPSSGSAP